MTLRDKIIMVAWILGLATFGLFLTGLWAVDQNAARREAEEQAEVEKRLLYQCSEAYVDYDTIDEIIARETAKVPFIEISNSDRYIVECVVAGEAGGHSYPLMKAVAQCMAVSMDMRGMTANEVRRDHGYHGYMPELEQTDPYAWAMVCSAVSEIFDEGNFVVYSPIEYFYNPSYGGGDFHEQKNFIIEIDGVRFFTDEEAD